MMERFRQLAPREQLLIGIGTGLLVLAICWQFVWVPLKNRSAELGERVVTSADLVVDLRLAADLNNASAGAGVAGVGSSLLIIVDQTGRPLGLETGSGLGRKTQLQGDAVRVELRNTPFDTLVNWLDILMRDYGVAVVSADMARSNVTGVINGQIVLERS